MALKPKDLGKPHEVLLALICFEWYTQFEDLIMGTETITAIAVKVADLIFTGAGEKIGGDLWKQLITTIKTILTNAGKQKILEDLKRDKKQEDKSEFQSALVEQMKTYETIANQLENLVEKIELERQNNNPTPGITGASLQNVETETGDRSPVDIGTTQGKDIKGADIKDVKTKTGSDSHVTLGKTTQTN
jgi:hypothetical protein